MAQIDMSIAQENIWLETDALGLGGVWIGIAPMQDRMDEVHDMLELPENVEVFSLFALGYPAEKENSRTGLMKQDPFRGIKQLTDCEET